MTQEEKTNLIEAVKFLKAVSSQAKVEEPIHFKCTEAANELLSAIEEEIKIKTPLNNAQ